MTPGMKRVLAVLREHGPMAKAKIIKLAFVGSVTFDKYVPILLAAGRAHIKEYIREGCGLPKAVFAIGHGQSAQRPVISDYSVLVTAPGVQRALKAIEASEVEMTPREVCKAANVSLKYFIANVRKLLLQHRLIHQSGWRHNTRGPFVPLYSFGPGSGKAPRRPPKLKSPPRQRAWKQRTGYNELQKALRRLRRPPDPAMAALLGLTNNKGESHESSL